jgi:hypothetical protein
MGIYLTVCTDDFTGPIGCVDRTYPANAYTGDLVQRRLEPRVRTRDRRHAETIPAIVSRIVQAVPAHSLDVILLFAHGYHDQAHASRSGFQEPTIKLGTGLTCGTAHSFRLITHLWSRRFELDSHTDFRVVVPRIELHVCYSGSPYNAPIARAFANACQAPVFACHPVQVVDNQVFEGEPVRFNPYTQFDQRGRELGEPDEQGVARAR